MFFQYFSNNSFES